MTRKLCLLFVAVILSVSAVHGQSIGSISGAVSDSTGAVLPGAQITVMNQGTTVKTELTTNDAGLYVASVLPVGVYKITVQAKGFKTASQTDIALSVNDKLAVNFTLTVGNVAEVVNVEASPISVDLATGTQQSVVNGTQVRELALVTRNYEELLNLLPGVTSNSVDQLYVGVTLPSGATATIPFSINGARSSANSWLVDGADNVDRGSNLTLLNTPSIDALAEFKVLRGAYSAENGRAGGGQINVVTKSGTNGFHGDIYEFVRNNAFAANNFLNNANRVNLGPDGIASPAPLRYNNFGWTLGGPIYVPGHYNQDKNKTFFFFSEEFRRVITYATAVGVLPTTGMLAGNFGTANVCVQYTGSTCNQQSNTIGKIDPVAAAYIKDVYSTIPLSATSTSLTSLFRNVYFFEQELYKIDHVFGPKLQVSARYLRDQIPTTEPQGLFTGAPVPGVSVTSTNSPGRNWTLKAISTFTSRWLNELGWSYSYGAIVSDPVGSLNSKYATDIAPLIKLPFPVTLKRVPSLSVSGGTAITSFGEYRDFNRNYNFFDNMTNVRGAHTLRFGFVVNSYQKTENAGGNNTGTFTFSPASVPTGVTTFQQAFANFLLGNVATFSQASLDLTPDMHQKQWELYLQDDWKFKSNLTLNVGLRYSQFHQPVDKNNLLTTFDPALYQSSQAAPLIATGTSVGLLAANAPAIYTNGISVNGGNSPYGAKVGKEHNNNFGPRFGFAWDPFKDGKTAVRGGYGVFFDSTLVGIYEQNIFQNPPFVNSVSISGTGVTFNNPAGGTATVSNSPKVLRATAPDFMVPYTQQWSFEIQRSIARGAVLNVSYVGTKGTHLLGIYDINTIPGNLAYSSGLVPTTTNFTSAASENILNLIRPYVGYNAINIIEPWADSNYHSLQVHGTKRFSGVNQVGFAYTWSKGLTDSQTDRSSAPQNRYDFHNSEYGPTQYDRRHVFSVNGIYMLPFFKAQKGLTGKALGGWQISAIGSAYTGLPFTAATSNTDPAATGLLGSSAQGARPDMICDPNSGAARDRVQWFNTACFAAVPAGQHRFGNAGRGTIRGPGYQSWSLSLSKNVLFGVDNRFRLQVRGEASNAFNHTNLSGIGSTNNTSTLFGTISSFRDPRIIQIGAKLYF